MRKPCVICGIEFDNPRNRKTCSQTCSNDLRVETYKRVEARNVEARREYDRKYYRENKQKCNEQSKRYWMEHREELLRKARERQPIANIKARLRRQANPEPYRERNRKEYHRQMRENGAAYRAKWRIRDRKSRAYAVAAKELGLFTGPIRSVHKSIANSIRNFLERGDAL